MSIPVGELTSVHPPRVTIDVEGVDHIVCYHSAHVVKNESRHGLPAIGLFNRDGELVGKFYPSSDEDSEPGLARTYLEMVDMVLAYKGQ